VQLKNNYIYSDHFSADNTIQSSGAVLVSPTLASNYSFPQRLATRVIFSHGVQFLTPKSGKADSFHWNSAQTRGIRQHLPRDLQPKDFLRHWLILAFSPQIFTQRDSLPASPCEPPPYAALALRRGFLDNQPPNILLQGFNRETNVAQKAE